MPPQATILRFYLTLVLLCYISARPLHPEMNAALDRGLGSLFGDDEDPLPEVPSSPETEKALPKRPHLPTIATEGLGGLLTAEGDILKVSSVQITTSSASRSASTFTSGAAITPFTATTSSSSSTSFPSPTMTPSDTKQASSSPGSEATEWKVIGIAAVSIGLIAGVILSILFFDSWWGFLLALVGKKKRGGTEDLVPDWANRDWEVKIASEDGHRYPTLASLESMTKKQDLTGTSPLISPTSDDARHSHSLVPTLPPPLYLPGGDPHPLEPLFRRPSASNRPVPHELVFRS
ncbi:ABC transporter protein [Mycena sanguinolenta]|uniref:ABC transporter protein n=1 Tax=Mycena sanguinolenta TaxID=230812 RepID=A0A8H7CHE0_9AGAR|nr:ABC transporter protein [Mycena sanguinolenta]